MSRATAPPPRGRFRRILGYASLALVVLLVLAGFRGFRDLTLARERAASLESQIEGTEHEITRLELKVERLRDDPVLLERLAREELGMVKPGDVVVVVEPDSTPDKSVSTPTPAPAAEPSSGRREPTSP